MPNTLQLYDLLFLWIFFFNTLPFHYLNENQQAMGIFWELIQQSKIEEQQQHAESLEERVQILEGELTKTRQLLSKALMALEEHLNTDIDGDGKTGV